MNISKVPFSSIGSHSPVRHAEPLPATAETDGSAGTVGASELAGARLGSRVVRAVSVAGATRLTEVDAHASSPVSFRSAPASPRHDGVAQHSPRMAPSHREFDLPDLKRESATPREAPSSVDSHGSSLHAQLASDNFYTVIEFTLAKHADVVSAADRSEINYLLRVGEDGEALSVLNQTALSKPDDLSPEVRALIAAAMKESLSEQDS